MSSPFGALIRAQKQAPTWSCEVDAQSVCLCEGICVNTVYNWICPPFCKKSIAIGGVRVGCLPPVLEDKKKKKALQRPLQLVLDFLQSLSSV